VFGRRVRNIAAAAAFTVTLGSTFGVGTAGAAGTVDAARHRHHHHHHGCDPDQVLNASRHHKGDDECGPPPTVPEVPLNLLLPLSGAAVAGGLFFTIRRRRIPVRSA